MTRRPTLLRTVRTIRYVVRDLCWMVSYCVGAGICVGICRVVWLIIWSVQERGVRL